MFCHETLNGAGRTLTQSDIITSLLMVQLIVSVALAANELAARHSNTWLVLAVAVAAHFRNPPPSPAPPV